MPAEKPARALKPKPTRPPYLTFAETRSPHGPTPLAPGVDPEGWRRAATPAAEGSAA
jgi:hypothetical protein